MYIDFDEIRDIAHKGVRRATVFMGLGLNAASDKNFVNYQLSQITGVDLVPPDADAVQIEVFKTEFSYWIMGNGLRELIETFNVFLDAIHRGCVLFKETKAGRTLPEILQAELKDFHFKGLGKKLAILKDHYQVEGKNIESLLSINKARNCLTHRRGVVGDEDLGKDGKLELKWKGFEIFIQTPFGEEFTFIPRLNTEPILLKDGGNVMLRFPKRTKTFSPGELLILSPSDLSEFCQIVAEETNFIGQSSIAHARSLGIPHRDEVDYQST